ncbi:MAG: EamA family transporter [Burkholderiaceae bacterium]|nr:EamA family transporter [Burkholderiaceae bacterium]
MPIEALAMVLCAALIHASWNFWMKKAAAPPVPFTFAVSLTMVVGYAPLALVLYHDQIGHIAASGWTVIAASAVLHVVYFLVLQRGYARADLSIVYPVARGVGPLLSALVAMAWLGETPSLASVVGLLLIVAGTFTIAGGWSLVTRRDASARTLTGVGWGAATGLCIASYTVNDGYAVRLLGIAPILFDWLSFLLRTALVAPMAWRERAQIMPMMKRSGRYVIAIGMISPVAYILVLTAMKSAPISHVAPAREVSMLFAAFLGARMLGEGELARRLLGAALIAGGVVGLTLA